MELLDLPPELRMMIWKCYIASTTISLLPQGGVGSEEPTPGNDALSLLLTCRQINEEAKHLPIELATFLFSNSTDLDEVFATGAGRKFAKLKYLHVNMFMYDDHIRYTAPDSIRNFEALRNFYKLDLKLLTLSLPSGDCLRVMPYALRRSLDLDRPVSHLWKALYYDQHRSYKFARSMLVRDIPTSDSITYKAEWSSPELHIFLPLVPSRFKHMLLNFLLVEGLQVRAEADILDIILRRVKRKRKDGGAEDDPNTISFEFWSSQAARQKQGFPLSLTPDAKDSIQHDQQGTHQKTFSTIEVSVIEHDASDQRDVVAEGRASVPIILDETSEEGRRREGVEKKAYQKYLENPLRVVSVVAKRHGS